MIRNFDISAFRKLKVKFYKGNDITWLMCSAGKHMLYHIPFDITDVVTDFCLPSNDAKRDACNADLRNIVRFI